MKRVFVWAPHHQFQEYTLSCPACASTGRHRKLTSNGFVDPRLVHCVYRSFLLVQAQYCCAECKSSWNAVSKEVVSQLPPHIQRRLPINIATHLPGGLALSRKLERRIIEDIELANYTVADVRRAVADRRVTHHARKVAEYLEDVKTFQTNRRRRRELFNRDDTEENINISIPLMTDHCDVYNEPLGLDSQIIRERFLGTGLQARCKLADLYMGQLPVTDFVCSDVCNSAAMTARVVTDGNLQKEAPFKGLYAIMNARKQIISYVLLRRESLPELSQMATDLFYRCVYQGEKFPAVWYLDNCCENTSEKANIQKAHDFISFIINEDPETARILLPEGVDPIKVLEGTEVKLDLFHLIQRIRKALPEKAQSADYFMKEVSDILCRRVPPRPRGEITSTEEKKEDDRHARITYSIGKIQELEELMQRCRPDPVTQKKHEASGEKGKVGPLGRTRSLVGKCGDSSPIHPHYVPPFALLTAFFVLPTNSPHPAQASPQLDVYCEKLEKAVLNARLHLQNECIVDVSQEKMQSIVEVDRFGRPTLKRGTNCLENGWSNIKPHLPDHPGILPLEVALKSRIFRLNVAQQAQFVKEEVYIEYSFTALEEVARIRALEVELKLPHTSAVMNFPGRSGNQRAAKFFRLFVQEWKTKLAAEDVPVFGAELSIATMDIPKLPDDADNRAKLIKEVHNILQMVKADARRVRQGTASFVDALISAVSEQLSKLRAGELVQASSSPSSSSASSSSTTLSGEELTKQKVIRRLRKGRYKNALSTTIKRATEKRPRSTNAIHDFSRENNDLIMSTVKKHTPTTSYTVTEARLMRRFIQTNMSFRSIELTWDMMATVCINLPPNDQFYRAVTPKTKGTLKDLKQIILDQKYLEEKGASVLPVPELVQCLDSALSELPGAVSASIEVFKRLLDSPDRAPVPHPVSTSSVNTTSHATRSLDIAADGTPVLVEERQTLVVERHQTPIVPWCIVCGLDVVFSVDGASSSGMKAGLHCSSCHAIFHLSCIPTVEDSLHPSRTGVCMPCLRRRGGVLVEQGTSMVVRDSEWNSTGTPMEIELLDSEMPVTTTSDKVTRFKWTVTEQDSVMEIFNRVLPEQNGDVALAIEEVIRILELEETPVRIPTGENARLKNTRRLRKLLDKRNVDRSVQRRNRNWSPPASPRGLETLAGMAASSTRVLSPSASSHHMTAPVIRIDDDGDTVMEDMEDTMASMNEEHQEQKEEQKVQEDYQLMIEEGVAEEVEEFKDDQPSTLQRTRSQTTETAAAAGTLKGYFELRSGPSSVRASTRQQTKDKPYDATLLPDISITRKAWNWDKVVAETPRRNYPDSAKLERPPNNGKLTAPLTSKEEKLYTHLLNVFQEKGKAGGVAWKGFWQRWRLYAVVYKHIVDTKGNPNAKHVFIYERSQRELKNMAQKYIRKKRR